MITIVGNDPKAWGYIPGFLNEADPRPAREQIDDHYKGGWVPMRGLRWGGEALHYPGDPPFYPISMLIFRDEILLIFEASIVMILQSDGGFECSRLD